MGVFITLEEPTEPMRKEAREAGFLEYGWENTLEHELKTRYPRLQILTIDELLHGSQVKMPPQYGTFKEAQRVPISAAEHPSFDF